MLQRYLPWVNLKEIVAAVVILEWVLIVFALPP